MPRPFAQQRVHCLCCCTNRQRIAHLVWIRLYMDHFWILFEEANEQWFEKGNVDLAMAKCKFVPYCDGFLF